MLRTISAVFSAVLLAVCMPAVAQDMTDPGSDLFGPGLVAPKLDFAEDPAFDDLAPDPVQAPSPPSITLPPGQHALVLEARLVDGGAALGDGVVWRVFRARPGLNGELPRLAEERGGTTAVAVPPGDYLVHAAFGRAGATKRVTVADQDKVESLVLNAGGLELNAVVGDEEPVPAEQLTFEVLQENESGELETIIPKATPGRVLRLSAGAYHVISRYGDVNAIVRADFEVEAGKLTEAVMRHTGAEVTLKLVSTEGGEAVANTSWTVLTQDNTTVHESVGAFPSLVLAEGGYTAVASHQGQIYSRDFTVEPGVDRDVEVRLSDLVRPEPELAPNAGPPELYSGPMAP
jgi:hypothetical protein